MIAGEPLDHIGSSCSWGGPASDLIGTAITLHAVKVISLILAAFLLAIQAQLWLGKGSLPRGVELRAALSATQAENEQARLRNAQLEAELRDLREGLEMVEEKARFELGMVKPDEIFVQVRR